MCTNLYQVCVLKLVQWELVKYMRARTSVLMIGHAGAVTNE